ncbi:MAG: Zn-dependent oligopeptidase [Actinomycetota bacterium]|nr:Zn-dependent oligopeptidase [Actinomycetota bacterium]
MPDSPVALALPADRSLWGEFVADRCDTNLDRARVLVDVLRRGTELGAMAVVDQWNDVELALAHAGSVASLLGEVHPEEAVRTLAEERGREVSRLTTEIGQDRDLYGVLAAAEDQLSQAAGADQDALRLLRLTLRDFRRAGVDRDEPTRTRLRKLAEREVALGQDFSRAIRDDVRTIRLRPEQLAGLPADYVDAHPPTLDGFVEISTDYPDSIPFRTFAEDAGARRDLMTAFLNRGWPRNDDVLRQLLASRHEHAQLLGYPSWPDFDAEVKMVRSGAAIAEFIERIADASRPSAERDLGVLLERLQIDRPADSGLNAADSAYYGELVRRENFDVDAHEVRRYFDFERVRAGLLEVTGRLFGLLYVPVPDAPVWHEEVVVYDVLFGDSAERLGRIYLDLHPRSGKFKHAAQFDLATGVTGQALPEGALVCNFSKGLVEHSDVVTLFHEFGHLVHHILGGHQRYARFSGVATEWDFVEAPSQMLEEWAWDANVLRCFALDEDGDAIPVALVERMRAANEFGKGYQARTQMFYAAVSYVLHCGPVEDLTATVRELQARYDVFDHIDGTHFQTSFGHLDGYSSGYYTYMWSLVIAKDMFSAFARDDLFDASVAHRYRDRVLAAGGSGDAADLVAGFLGRPYNFDAFAAWLERAA